MKLVRDARTLKAKSISSLKTAMSAFNSYDDDGRITLVLMNLQHACEMLLKAVLSQRKVKVFDKGDWQVDWVRALPGSLCRPPPTNDGRGRYHARN